MKNNIYILAFLTLFLSSCISVNVSSDYDSKTNFSSYSTFAYSKSGIDKAEINDLDKKRILRALDAELLIKGFSKSENPEVLVSFFTKSNEQIDVNRNNFGWGFGGGFIGGSFGTNVSRSTQGILYIDLIDTKTNELIWQGKGSGYLTTGNVEKKEARIKEFVSKILEAYPPETN
ncbi:DUF4136 domain-containing protein [Aurantibacter sp.]|uniref:DUF4136 domain-containing protein n=1 Tax=Aurantibacter sp. TaxID=2807103 RepID=UPI0035C8529E